MPPLPLKLLSGRAHPRLAGILAGELDLPVEPVTVEPFADGEIRVVLESDWRGAAALIVQPTSPPAVNDHLMELLLLADAAWGSGAARVIAVVPYFGYGRQEQRGGRGEPRSAQVVCRMLGLAGFDHLVALDLHAPALESALPMPMTALRAEEIFLPALRGWDLERPVLVAPDAGGLKRAQRMATLLGGGLACVAKDRPSPDAVSAVTVLGEVRGRVCIIVDDLASTGHTLAVAARALKQAGAAEVHAVFTHAVLAGGGFDVLLDAPLERLMTSDSVPVEEHPRLEVVPIAPLLAKAVRGLDMVHGM